MNPLSYQLALCRRNELLRAAANHRLIHGPRPRPAAMNKPTRRSLPRLRRALHPRSA